MSLVQEERPALGQGTADLGPFSDADVAKLAALPDDELARLDFGALNLRCAVGLPGAEGLDVEASLRKMESWTNFVRLNTERWLPNFSRARESCNNSLAQFRMMSFSQALKQHLGVKYYLPFSEGEYNATDSQNLFLHGILSGHGGTCVSLPTLFLVVGRRLGYPLHLVQAMQHFFVRWEERGGERFNIETTGNEGWSHPGDDHYKTWPKPISAEQLETGRYLHNLSRRAELASFFCVRGGCLFDNLRFREAAEAYRQAQFFGPEGGAIIGGQAASVMLRAAEEAVRSGNGGESGGIRLATLAIPSYANEEWTRRVHATARAGLRRLLAIHGQGVIVPEQAVARVATASLPPDATMATVADTIFERGDLFDAARHDEFGF